MPINHHEDRETQLFQAVMGPVLNFVKQVGSRALLVGVLGLPGCASPAAATPGPSSAPSPAPSPEFVDFAEMDMNRMSREIDECEKIESPAFRMSQLSQIESDLAFLRTNSPRRKILIQKVRDAIDSVIESIRVSQGGRKRPEKGENKEGKAYEFFTKVQVINGAVTVTDVQRDQDGTYKNGQRITEEAYEEEKRKMGR